MKYLGLLFLVACITTTKPVIHPQNPLVKQILSPRIGYKTLTNSYQDPVTGVIKITEYDLNDSNVRTTLKSLGFRCDVAAKMYFICANGPGLCRREADTYTGWGPFKKSHEKFADSIDINLQYDFLLAAKTRCESSRVEQIN